MYTYYSYHFGHEDDFPTQVERLETFHKVNVSDYTDAGTYHILLDNDRIALVETTVDENSAERFVEVYL